MGFYSDKITDAVHEFERRNEEYVSSLVKQYKHGDLSPLIGLGLHVLTAELSFRMYLALAKRAKAQGWNKTSNLFKAWAYGTNAVNCVTAIYHGGAHVRALAIITLANKSTNFDVEIN